MPTLAPSTLPGSLVQCLEEDGQFVIDIPARPRRFIAASSGAVTLLVGMLVVLFYFIAPDAPGFAIIGMSTFVAAMLCLVCLGLVQVYLTRTSVLVTHDSVVIKHSRFGREQLEHYTLSGPTRARQWFPEPKPGRRMQPLGIVIEAKEGPARFGSSLRQGELDWLEWRISRFLGTARDDDAPLLAVVAGEVAGNRGIEASLEPWPPPYESHVRVEDRGHETVFHLPNTRQTGTFTGIGSIVFGLAIIGGYLWYFWPALGGTELETGELVMICVGGLFALLGIASVLNGLTELFGAKRLTISRDRIVYRAGVFGLAVWWTLRTADVISAGSWTPAEQRRNAADGGGCIRTARRDIRYGHAVPRDEREWVYHEVVRLILAVRF
ncbi:MAG: hypothetical protein WD294_10100 [Phycisphaeraceae bacterium]